MKNRILLVGLGNILLRDDGVGIHIICALREKYDFDPPVEIIDGGTAGLDLLPFFERGDQVLIVDAVDSGMEPGHIEEIEGRGISCFVQSKFSAHQIGLSDLLSVLKLTDMEPAKTCLIGIQPASMDVGLSLTDRIRSETDRLIHLIIERLEAWGVRCVLRSP